MIEIHLKDGSVIGSDAPGEEVRFTHNEGYLLERKKDDKWITVAAISADSFSFMYVADDVTLKLAGKPDASGE